MASGIRIRPTRPCPSDALIVLNDIARPFPPPVTGERLEDVIGTCARCGVQHFFKTYHIDLRRGTAIVSEEVWDNLRRMADNPFEFVNEVPDPPVQHLNINMSSNGQSSGTITHLEKYVTNIDTGSV